MAGPRDQHFGVAAIPGHDFYLGFRVAGHLFPKHKRGRAAVYLLKGAALSRVVKKEKNVLGKLQTEKFSSISGEFVSVTGGRLEFMGMRGLKHYI